jgi:hypothetical protein
MKIPLIRVVSLLIATAPLVAVGNSVGSIAEVTGSASTIHRNSNVLSGEVSTLIEMSDKITTSRGKAGIVFVDGTRAQINENSSLVIDEFVFDPANNDKSKLTLNMASGTVRYASGKIAHNNPNSVSIKTPAATVAVRGTDFTATIDELGASTIILLPECPRKDIPMEEIAMLCKTGKIEVINDAGRVMLDEPFQATTVTSRWTSPSPPVHLRLNEDSISNLLILSPPTEIKNQKIGHLANNALTQNFLKFNGLNNTLADANGTVMVNVITSDFLNTDMLKQITQIVIDKSTTVAAKSATTTAVPVVAAVHTAEPTVQDPGLISTSNGLTTTICHPDTARDNSCISSPRNQGTVVNFVQGNTNIVTKINQGGNTTIVLRQN